MANRDVDKTLLSDRELKSNREENTASRSDHVGEDTPAENRQRTVAAKETREVSLDAETVISDSQVHQSPVPDVSSKTHRPDVDLEGETKRSQTKVIEPTVGAEPGGEDSFSSTDCEAKIPSLVGQTIGDYEILAELGRGGMGVVYKAHERKLDRIVALKMILSGSHACVDTITRFIKEARAVAHLHHPGIVQIYEIGESDGLPYFSLEYVEGQSLDEMFKEEPAEPEQAARIVIDLAESIHYAHEQGLLHRDLKPANVLMCDNQEPKILDFGLAKQIEADGGETVTGAILGTPGYMPPEQAMAKELTPAADQYALGAILYRMICGRAPFVSSRTMDTLMQVITLVPVPMKQLAPGVPHDLDTICQKALSKDPQQRYENCQALADDLRRFINHEPIIARPVGSFGKLNRWRKRNPKIAALVATTFGLLLAIAGLTTWSSFAIANERDRVQDQKQIADKNLVIAKQNEEKAKANALLAQENEEKARQSEELTREQAQKIVKTMQKVLTDIDRPLRADPNLATTRLEVMKSLSKSFTDLEIELHTDVKSQAIPTFMAIRFNLVQIFSSLNEGKLANEEIKRVYEMGKERIVVKEGTDAARSNLVKICLTHATITEKAEGLEASKPYLDEALSVARDIIANPKPSEEPGTPPLFELKYLLSNSLQSMGVYYYNRGMLTEAAPRFEEAGQIRNALLDELNEDEAFKAKPKGYQKAFANSVKINAKRSLLGAATILFKAGEFEKGLEQFQTVYDRVVKQFEDDPSDQNQIELGKIAGNFGFNCFKMGKQDQAVELMQRNDSIAAKFAEKNPKDFDAQYTWSVALYRNATVLEGSDAAVAQKKYAKCVEIREKLVQQDANLKNETMLMVAYARKGDTGKALAIADRLNSNSELNGKMKIDIARAYAQCSRHTAAEAKKGLLDKSVVTIRQAVEKGYSDWFELKSEPDLKPIQDLDEFKALLK